MIQELFGGSNVGIISNGERSKQLSTPPPCGGGSIVDGSSSHSPSASASAAAAENLRCPRCDSSNTKFCYYNNYNLTQPRHFCKTCRRYWTKGGALRNVPIGGGCRKNKNTTISVGKSCAAGKLKTSEIGKTTATLFSGSEHARDHEHALSSNPILWASSQNSHFLSLLRSANQTAPKPIKDETLLYGSSLSSTNFFGFDSLGPARLHQNQSQSIIYDDVHNNNIGSQELYQRLRSSSASGCYPEHSPLILGNMASANSSTILESAPVASTSELGMFWNPTVSWPTNLPSTNGAYP